MTTKGSSKTTHRNQHNIIASLKQAETYTRASYASPAGSNSSTCRTHKTTSQPTALDSDELVSDTQFLTSSKQSQRCSRRCEVLICCLPEKLARQANMPLPVPVVGVNSEILHVRR